MAMGTPKECPGCATAVAIPAPSERSADRGGSGGECFWAGPGAAPTAGAGGVLVATAGLAEGKGGRSGEPGRGTAAPATWPGTAGAEVAGDVESAGLTGVVAAGKDSVPVASSGGSSTYIHECSSASLALMRSLGFFANSRATKSRPARRGQQNGQRKRNPRRCHHLPSHINTRHPRAFIATRTATRGPKAGSTHPVVTTISKQSG
jgi:hypothetical protein